MVLTQEKKTEKIFWCKTPLLLLNTSGHDLTGKRKMVQFGAF